MSPRELLSELKVLARLKNNWYSVAVTFEKVKLHCAGQEHITRRIKEACEASGYSMNTINRMLTVKAFFEIGRAHV